MSDYLADIKKNYSEEQETELIKEFSKVKTYKQQTNLAEKLAKRGGFFAGIKTKEQLLGKLAYMSRAGVETVVDPIRPLYIKKVYTTKAGARVISKAEVVTYIADTLSISEDILSSLKSCTKPALLVLLAELQKRDNKIRALENGTPYPADTSNILKEDIINELNRSNSFLGLNSCTEEAKLILLLELQARDDKINA